MDFYHGLLSAVPAQLQTQDGPVTPGDKLTQKTDDGAKPEKQLPSDAAASEKANPKEATTKPQAAEARAAAPNLAKAPAFDLVYLKDQREPVKVYATLPRPLKPDTFRRGQKLKLERYRPDRAASGQSFEIKAEEIARVELFEEILEREGNKALERRDFSNAFDLFARLVEKDPHWPRASDKLHQVFTRQAQDALAKSPPDYDTTVALCLQLLALDKKAPEAQSLMRRACLVRADEAIKNAEYVAARDHISLFLQHYAGDAQAMELQQKLAKKAQALADQAQNAIDGTLEQQRSAVGLLAEARQIWPDLKDIDRLMLKAKRGYPVFSVAVFEEPGTFEPLGALSLTERQACQLLFDSLIEPDESGGQFFKGPILADAKQGPLGLTQRFVVERGQRWSDGKPVTAYDVEKSLRLWLDPSGANYDPERARFIADVFVEPLYTVKIDLARPHPRAWSLFAVPLLPQHLVSEPPKRGSTFTREPVGTGPFKIGKPDAPQQTKFVANPEFRNARLGQPYIKEINFQHYVKSSAAVRDLEAAKIHLMTRLDPLEVIRFSKLTGQFETRNYLSNSVYILAINHRRRPFDDLRIRRAILLGIDRQGILTQYFMAGPGGLAHKVVTGPFPTHSPAYDTDVVVLPKDEALARQLVEEVKRAGWISARPLTLKYPQGDPAVEKAASQLKKELQRVGLEDLKTEAKIESDLRSEVIDQQDFDLVYWRIDHNVLYNIASLFDSDPESRKPGGTNFMGYQHSELTKLFSQLRQEQQPLNLWEIQRAIHRFMKREVVFIPLWQLDNYIAYTSKLTYRQAAGEDGRAVAGRQVPIHPLYLFRKPEGWDLEP